jgi:hypothetical protein
MRGKKQDGAASASERKGAPDRPPTAGAARLAREQRLAAALRANLRRRKQSVEKEKD